MSEPKNPYEWETLKSMGQWRNEKNKPWSNEPDQTVEEYRNHIIFVNRNTDLGFLCGYVILPKTHRLHGESLYDRGYLVHGGITYCGPASNLPIKCESDSWAVGFDCGHGGDLIPFMDRGDSPYNVRPYLMGDTYRTMEYVIAECIGLVDQMIGDYLE